jgi:3-hydroxyacyl-[acyl-carrier-protein] dehydratase
MPGVLILEAMAQTAGAISMFKMGLENAGSVFLLTIDNAKFRRPVVPGDQMLLRVKKMKQRGNISKFACIAEVDGVKVAEADVSAMTGA